MDFLARHRAVTTSPCTSKNIQLDLEEVAHMAALAEMSEQEIEARIDEILERNKELFEEEIGRVNHYVHKIKMNTKTPYKTKTYPIPEKHRKTVTKYINELERDGIIQKAPTQYINSLVVVVKKNGKIRLCLDARELNKRMSNDHEQPPFYQRGVPTY